MRLGALTFGMACCLAASPALAESWRASSRGMGAVAYIDVDSIKRKGDQVSFWRELRWPEVRRLGSNLRYDRMAALYEADCHAMTLRSMKIRVSLGDEVVFKDDAEDEVEVAAPGTTAEIDLRSVCLNDWPAGD